jgi:serine/threonine protein kinase/TPR repeat protein/uncharacterized RDD family membrane protein YckC
VRVAQAGDVLSKQYRLLKAVGRGGMGVVWKAEDLVGSRPVCIKLLPPEIQTDEVELDRLRSTFRKVHALQHQHLCPLYSLGSDPVFRAFLVMKFIDGVTLAEFRQFVVGKQGSFPFRDVIRLVAPVARCLDYIHGQGIVHRDLKPSNILVSRDGKDVQLVDLGLAAEIRTSLSRLSRRSQDFAGTAPYMAPEQWRGQPLDGRADQFALATLTYELATGKLPFDCADDAQWMNRAIQGELPPHPALPPAVLDALRKARLADRQQRFASCFDLMKQLSETASTATAVPATAPRPTPAPVAAPITIQPVSSGVFPGVTIPQPPARSGVRAVPGLPTAPSGPDQPPPLPQVPLPPPLPMAPAGIRCDFSPEAFATLGERFAAATLDGLVLLTLGILLGAVIGAAMGLAAIPLEIVQIVSFIAGTVLGWLYYAILESSPMRATLGKMACGLETVRLDGDPLSFGEATVRGLGRQLSTTLLGVGFLAFLWSPRRQCWHDAWAGAVVIKKNRRTKFAPLPAVTRRVQTPAELSVARAWYAWAGTGVIGCLILGLWFAFQGGSRPVSSPTPAPDSSPGQIAAVVENPLPPDAPVSNAKPTSTTQSALRKWFGDGEPLDMFAAAKEFDRSAAAGDALATAFVALDLLDGRTREVDQKEGLRRLKRVLPAMRLLLVDNDPHAMWVMSIAAERGLSDEVDAADLHRRTMSLANSGLRIAQTLAGYNHRIGFAVPKDDAEAFRWFRLAAEQGCPRAQMNLGTLYNSGQGTTKSLEDSFLWYKRAADQGHPDALHSCGYAYEYGVGVAKSRDDAIRCYRQASDKQHAYASFRLGMLLDPSQAGGSSPEQVESRQRTRLAMDRYARVLSHGKQPPDSDTITNFLDCSQRLIEVAVAENNLRDVSAAAETVRLLATDLPDSHAAYCVVAILNARAGLELKQDPNSRPFESLEYAIEVGRPFLDSSPWNYYLRDSLGGCYKRLAEIEETGKDLPGEAKARQAWLTIVGEYVLGMKLDGLPVAVTSPTEADVIKLREAMQNAPSRKKFTVPCNFGGVEAPFDIYIGNIPWPRDPLADQVRWLKELRGGEFKSEVLDAFRKVQKIAHDNNVNFPELCVSALEAVKKEAEKKSRNAK